MRLDVNLSFDVPTDDPDEARARAEEIIAGVPHLWLQAFGKLTHEEWTRWGEMKASAEQARANASCVISDGTATPNTGDWNTIAVRLRYRDGALTPGGEARCEPSTPDELIEEIDRAMNASHFGGQIQLERA